ncbi:MAG: DNA primase [Ruminococcaceae bacterium]|nr:DNA primase [Oscillospiraceae bacterium]
MRLPENFVQEVLDRTNIEELVGRYVNLKRTGSNLVGLCPFHSEKTPSFTVSPDKRMFFCFGCHAGGSAITFVQKAENMEFVDAVAFLAERAGLPMPRESEERATGESVSRKRVLEANLEAAKFFRACLFDPAIGAPGMEYFKQKRGLSDATIKHFGLGYAPDTFGSLTEYLHGKGFTDKELQVAFLCGKSSKTGRSYDYFRGRVMFPILDTSGNVVAFGGRVLDDSKPKYLNTSDTPAFKKSNHLFALNFARHSGAERMILCEGYMDVIAMHAAGFENAVATLGTAITPNHARIFSKYTKQVIISYDADEAGQAAAKKAMQILSEVGVEVRVLRVEGAKDPDEYIRKYGAERFSRLLDGSRTGFEYQLDTILARHDLSIGQEKIKASSELCAAIAEYSSAVEREVYLDAASKRLELPIEALRNSVEKIRRKKYEDYKARESREVRASIKNFGDRINPDSAKDPKAAATEEAVIGLLLMFEEYRREVVSGRIQLEATDFVTDFYRRVFESILKLQNSESGFQFALLGEDFSPDEMGRIQKAEMTRRELTQNGPDVFRNTVKNLRAISEQSRSKNTDLQTKLENIRKLKLHKRKDPNE